MYIDDSGSFESYGPGYHHQDGANLLTGDGAVAHQNRDEYQPLWDVDNMRMVSELGGEH